MSLPDDPSDSSTDETGATDEEGSASRSSPTSPPDRDPQHSRAPLPIGRGALGTAIFPEGVRSGERSAPASSDGNCQGSESGDPSTAQRVLQGINQGVSTTQEVVQAASSGSVASRVTGVVGAATQGVTSALSNVPGMREANGVISTSMAAVSAVRGGIEALQQGRGGGSSSGAGSSAQADGSGDGAHALPRVRFAFRSQAQTHASWRVLRFRGTEGLSQSYVWDIELLTEDIADANWRALRRHRATLSILRGEHEHHVHGIVTHVRRRGVQGRRLCIALRLESSLALLDQSVSCEIRQNVRVPALVDELLRGALGDWGAARVSNALTRAYAEHESLTRYNESLLQWVQRLLAEEGIGYALRENGETESVTLFDGNNAFNPLASHEDGVIQVRDQQRDLSPDESVYEFQQVENETSTELAFDDHDWTRPSLELQQHGGVPGAEGPRRERYQWPAPLNIGSFETGQRSYTADDGRAQLEWRKQLASNEIVRAEGRSNAVMLRAGVTVQLRGHGEADCNRRWLVTSVRHEGYAPEELTVDSHGNDEHVPNDERYSNAFTVLPHDVNFRPQPVPKQRILGFQTAVVVGPEGEEIFTDIHGRIKVQLRWDRADVAPEQRSRWIRAAQGWAGPGFGWQFTPRIGMEVLLVFEDGDPDRPVAVQCLYNGQNAYPWELPANKTQSGVKTQSSPNRDTSHFNQIRFEDKAGRERIDLQAQRDFSEIIKRRHTVDVGGNEDTHVSGAQSNTIDQVQTNHVDKNRVTTIGQDDILRVTGNRLEDVTLNMNNTVHGTRTDTVEGWEQRTVVGDQGIEVRGTHEHHVVGAVRQQSDNTRTVHVQGDDRETFAANKWVHVHGAYDVRVDERLHAHQAGAALTLTGGHAQLSAEGHGHLKVGVENGIINVTAAQQLILRCGSASIEMHASGAVTITGSTGVRMASGASSVAVAPGGVTENGPRITSSAVATNEVSGALVKVG